MSQRRVGDLGRKRTRKVYYYADTYETQEGKQGIVFKGQDWSKMYRAGGNEHQQRYIIEQLIKNHWVDLWYEIYKNYNQALLDVSSSLVPSHWGFPKASITLIREDYEWARIKQKFNSLLEDDDKSWEKERCQAD